MSLSAALLPYAGLLLRGSAVMLPLPSADMLPVAAMLQSSHAAVMYAAVLPSAAFFAVRSHVAMGYLCSHAGLCCHAAG